MTSPNISARIGRTICGSSTVPSFESLTNDTFLEDSSLTTAQKKRKLEEIYSSGRWKDACGYEVK